MDASTLTILSSAVFLGFFVQTIFAFAASLIALPILLFIMPLHDAIALMAIFLVVFSVITVYAYRSKINKKVLLKLSTSTFLGVILGVLLLKFGNPVILQQGLGLFIIVYVLYEYIKKEKIAAFSKLGLFFGFLGGIFSGLYNTGGPLLVTYIKSKLEDVQEIRATLLAALGVINIVRIPILGVGEMFSQQVLTYFLIALPVFLLAVYLGHLLYKKVNAEVFKHGISALLFISGVMLILK